ncbi:MAG: hypothetical protein COW02_05065 [Comamonadaceae bacterium CG12_big_fil_rev_8_21_14_0_65_59_15]|nr:MAG: hypothetical protein COW02_05065 [Comamonadaceae bacterium CG12_big_fil_rev_8_21_14_0_65_59_15]
MRSAELGDPPRDYAPMMKQYLDEVVNMAVEEVLSSIAQEPVPISPIFDAHIAGMAEYIADRYAVERPAWIEGMPRFLPEPVFFGGRRSHQHMLVSTNDAMRRRNLFCGEITLQAFKSKGAAK